jgi:AcrR family transcriptional regulator
MVQIRARPKAEARRLEILRAAAGVFRDRGFHHASMEEIADRLQMTKGNLYYYFPGKQDLLYFCQQEALSRLLLRADVTMSGDGTWAEKLARLINDHLSCVLDEVGGSLAHSEFEELAPLQRRQTATRRDRYEEIFRDVVRMGVRSGEFERGDAKLRALAILGALNWTVKWFRPGGGETAEHIGRSFADLLVRGLVRRPRVITVARAAAKSPRTARRKP